MQDMRNYLKPEWGVFWGKLLSIICDKYDGKSLYELFKITVEDNNDSNLSNVVTINNLGVIDPLTFISKTKNVNVTEVHHLIPMVYQNKFEANLDVEANIVSLCCNCHKWIHLGKDAEELICILYEERKEILKKVI